MARRGLQRPLITASAPDDVVGRVEHDVEGIEPYPVEAGRTAFGVPASLVLRLLRRRDFRFLREARDPSR